MGQDNFRKRIEVLERAVQALALMHYDACLSQLADLRRVLDSQPAEVRAAQVELTRPMVDASEERLGEARKTCRLLGVDPGAPPGSAEARAS